MIYDRLLFKLVCFGDTPARLVLAPGETSCSIRDQSNVRSKRKTGRFSGEFVSRTDKDCTAGNKTTTLNDHTRRILRKIVQRNGRLKNNIRIQSMYILYTHIQNIHMTCINAIIIVLPVTYCISNGLSFVQRYTFTHYKNAQSEYELWRIGVHFFEVRIQFQIPRHLVGTRWDRSILYMYNVHVYLLNSSVKTAKSTLTHYT